MRVARAALALVYFAISLGVLAFGHPAEDAYILFKYARNLAEGHGIVYYPGGPHAEGATDFLWMVVLAAGAKVGIDPAIGAALLSTGAFYLTLRLIDTREPILLGVLLLWPPAVAAYVGFSAMVFSALALLLFCLHVQKKNAWVPLAGILLALVRPDGALIGVPLAVFALLKERTLKQLGLTILAGAIGVVYFVWRRNYFGMDLPLPLYVKGHYVGRPPGVDATLDWMASTLLPIGLVAAGARVLLGKRVEPPTRRELLGIAPFVLHTLSFATGYPSQNTGNRFQGPLALLLFFLLVKPRVRTERVRRAVYAGGFVFAMFPLYYIAIDIAIGTFGLQYMDRFAHEIGPMNARIATTEAGRIAYWTRGPVIDLVGLNTRETALAPPSHALLDAFDADVIMLHHAGTFDESGIEGGAVIPFTEPIDARLRWWAKPFLVPAMPPYGPLIADNVAAAPAAALGYLHARRDRYDVYLVRFPNRHVAFHVYGIKKDFARRAELLRALEATHDPRSHRSYLSLRY